MARPLPAFSAWRITGIAFFAVWIAIVHHALRAELRDVWTWVIFGSFGASVALGLALPPLGRAFSSALLRPPTWAFLAATSAAAAGITLYFALSPMRGQTASLDGSVYIFQGRALANLSFGFPIPEPRLIFGMRFLFEGADGDMHGVFPIGYPLFLAPFLAIGAPLLSYVTMAVLLVLVQYALTRAIAHTEWAARLSVLLTLPSWGRVIETAEPVSHALVGVLVALTLLLTLRLPTSSKPWRIALALGACAGWTFAARLLDGIVLGMTLGPLLLFWAFKARIGKASLPLIVLGTLPFVGLLLAQQHAATGSFFRPNVSEYAIRADWPPTCLRLGLGQDIGCAIEHPFERASFGPDGYQLDDALRLVRERAEVLGPDLLGSSWLLLLAFVPFFLAYRRSGTTTHEDEGSKKLSTLFAGGFLIALTLAYGLYYYGNHPIWGARHLFPAAPFVFALIARGAEALRLPYRQSEGGLDSPPGLGALAFALVLTVTVAAYPVWNHRLERVHYDQSFRVDLRGLIADEKIDRGIVTTLDILGVLVGWDPWADQDRRFVVLDSAFAAHDLRALHPNLPVYAARPPHDITREEPPIPEKAFVIELERAWPSFQRPDGLGAGMIYDERSRNVPALYVAFSKPGAKLTIPIWIPESGRYSVRLKSVQGPDHGDYKITLDDHVLPLHRGYAPEYRNAITAPSLPIELSKGRHVFVAECLGKQKESAGYRAIFDALNGTAVE